MTRNQIIVELCALDWAEIIEQFAGQTHNEIYNKLQEAYPHADNECLALAIYRELSV